MQEKKIPFEQLKEAVLSQHKAQGYMDSTLSLYSSKLRSIQKFLSENNRQYYCPETGPEFLAALQIQRSTMSGYICAVRRLDDYLNGRPYRCHHGGDSIQLSECYAGILEEYLSSCRNAGNKPETLKTKEAAVSRFSGFYGTTDAGISAALAQDLFPGHY